MSGGQGKKRVRGEGKSEWGMKRCVFLCLLTKDIRLLCARVSDSIRPAPLGWRRGFVLRAHEFVPLAASVTGAGAIADGGAGHWRGALPRVRHGNGGAGGGGVAAGQPACVGVDRVGEEGR